MTRPQDSLGYIGPLVGAVSVTASDSTEHSPPLRGIYVGTSGDLRVIFTNGDDITFSSLAAGVVHPIVDVKQVMSTSTTATGIIGGK